MKRMIATLTLLSASTLLATPWFITEGNFSGKGVWANVSGQKGTYESSMIIKQNKETRSEFGELTIVGSTKVLNKDEVLHEERSSTAWRFIGWGKFEIVEGEYIIGEGHCAMMTCKYTYKKADECGGETLRYFPKKSLIKVKGNWCDKDSRGEYKGYLCKKCEEKKAEQK